VLLCRSAIDLPRGILIKERAVALVTAAPVLVPTGNAEEIARPHALFAGVILVEISAFDTHNPDVGRVRMHTRIESRLEFRKCSMDTFVWIAPKRGHRGGLARKLFVRGLIGSCIDDLLCMAACGLFLSLRNAGPRD